MHALMGNGEPAEWVGRQPPEFARRPSTSEERTLNFSKYLTGYPWIVIVGDKGSTARYFCGICAKVATVTHILSSDHIENTTTKFHKMLGYQIPSWMENFRGFNTTDKAGDLFADDEYELWPEVRSECNCKLAEAQHSGCNVCRPAATRKSDSTVERGSDRTSGGDSKRFRATYSKSDDEEGRSSKPKIAVARSPVHDFRERPPDPKHSGDKQTEVRKNCWHQPEGTRGSHTDKDEPRHEVDSQLAMVKPRCHDEPRLRAGYTRDMEKHMQEHNRLFTMDQYSPYGPWPMDFSDWTSFHNALYKSPNGTTTMDANIEMDFAKPVIIVRPPPRWEF